MGLKAVDSGTSIFHKRSGLHSRDMRERDQESC